MGTTGFIGGGNMAEAIIKGIISADVYKSADVYVSDIRKERLVELAERYGVTTFEDNASLAAGADVVVLSVKPYTMADALDSIRDHIRTDSLIVSIVAGKTVADITAVLGDIPVIRVMPNTPALIAEGASGLYANDKATPQLEQIRSIFQCVGKTLLLDREELIDAVTAVSGSGPAYYYLLMSEMVNAAVKLGLSQSDAVTLVLQTARGAALLADISQAQGESPADLSRKVATPGGTTEAALNAFNDGGFGPLVEKALTAARDRSRELASS